MDMESSEQVTAEQIASLSDKLSAFAAGLEAPEKALLEALVNSAGGVGESEVEGFGFGDFHSASGRALGAFGGGLISMGPMSANWGQWTKETSDGWKNNIDHQPTTKFG